MTRRIIPSLILGLLLPLAAQAQETRVYIGTGPAFPSGPGNVVDFWNRGLTFDAGVGLKTESRLEFTLSFGRASLPIANDKLLAVGANLQTSGGDFSVTSGRVGARMELERGTWFRPYLHVGAGLFRIEYEALDIEVSNPQDVCGQASCDLRFTPSERPTETVPGIQLAAGIAYYFADHVWLYAEPSYHIMFAEERTGILPLRIGIARALK